MPERSVWLKFSEISWIRLAEELSRSSWSGVSLEDRWGHMAVMLMLRDIELV